MEVVQSVASKVFNKREFLLDNFVIISAARLVKRKNNVILPLINSDGVIGKLDNVQTGIAISIKI